MIVLNRESIIEGLIEIRKEEDLENSIIVNNIKSIIDLNDISNLDKLKLINISFTIRQKHTIQTRSKKLRQYTLLKT